MWGPKVSSVSCPSLASSTCQAQEVKKALDKKEAIIQGCPWSRDWRLDLFTAASGRERNEFPVRAAWRRVSVSPLTPHCLDSYGFTVSPEAMTVFHVWSFLSGSRVPAVRP